MREAIFLGWVLWGVGVLTLAAFDQGSVSLMLAACGVVMFLASWLEVLDADKEKDLPL